MARHAQRAARTSRVRERRGFGAALPAVGICVLLVGAVVLGVWWWNLKSVTDPIDADPVDAYAVVVSSPPCADGNQTTVTISGTQPARTATLSGCGFTAGQRLAVQYLAGHPEQARRAGTTVAGESGLASRLLPLGILAAGLVAVLSAIALLVDRRRSRHVAAAHRVTVADLAARRAAAAATGQDDAGDAAQPGSGDGAADGGAVGGDAESADAPMPFDPADLSEPAHILPSGFVIVEEQLFTHSGSQAAPEADQRLG